MAIKNKIIPPEILIAAWLKPKPFKIDEPKNTKKTRTKNAIIHSRKIIYKRRRRGSFFNNERKIGMFPIGSITNTKVIILEYKFINFQLSGNIPIQFH
jgi:hypothetical protein